MPKDSSPNDILLEAYQSMLSMDYPAALESIAWFYKNSERIDPAMYGVKNSFALGLWIELSRVYPRAYEEFENTLTEIVRRIMSGEGGGGDFIDAASMLSAVKRTPEAITLYRWCERNRPEIAENTFRFMKSTLLKEQETFNSSYVGRIADIVNLLLSNYRAIISGNRSQKRRRDALEIMAHEVIEYQELLMADDRHADARELIYTVEESLCERDRIAFREFTNPKKGGTGSGPDTSQM